MGFVINIINISTILGYYYNLPTNNFTSFVESNVDFSFTDDININALLLCSAYTTGKEKTALGELLLIMSVMT